MADNLTQKLFPGSDPLAIPVLLPPSSRPYTCDYYNKRNKRGEEEQEPVSQSSRHSNSNARLMDF